MHGFAARRGRALVRVVAEQLARQVCKPCAACYIFCIQNTLRRIGQRLLTSPLFWIGAIVAGMMAFIFRYDLPIVYLVEGTYHIGGH